MSKTMGEEKASMNPVAFLRYRIKAHHFGRVALVLGAVCAAFVLFVFGAAIRLFVGPVSLGPFAGSLSAAIDKAVPGITVKYDQAAVEWEREEGKITLAILGTRVLDHDGRIIAQAPKAEIALAAGPLLSGKIEVKRIGLVGVQLTLVRKADGSLQLGVGKDRQNNDILKRLSDALKKNEGPSTLESFAVRHARLAFYDESSKLFVVAPQANFRLSHVKARRNVSEHLAAQIDADVEISGTPAHVSSDIVIPSGKGPVTGSLALKNVSVQALALNSAAFAAMKTTALKVDVETSFVQADGKLASADFIMTGKGILSVPNLKNGKLQVERLTAKGHFNGKTSQLVLNHASLIADKLKADIDGHLGFSVDAAGDIAVVTGELRLARLGVAWPGVFAKPVQFEKIELRAAYKVAEKTLVLDRLAIRGSPFSLQSAGHIGFVPGQSPAVDIKGTIAALDVRDLVRYWPLEAAPGGRSWAEANMPTGYLGPINFAIHFVPGALDAAELPADAVNVTAAVSNAEVAYIKGLTHITNVSGTLSITGNSLTANIMSGRIGAIVAGPSKFAIPDFNTDVEVGTIDAHLQGPMADVLALVDMGNLRYPTRFGINVASAKGDVGLDLNFSIPLLKSVSVDQIKMGIKANATGFALALGPRLTVTDGNILFQIDNAKLRATGSSGVGGSASRLTLDWTEEFKEKPVTTKISVKGAVDDVARSALGINTKSYLKGPIGISGTLTGHRGSLAQANFALDLTPTAVTVDLIAVNKPAGFPLTGRVAITFGPGSSVDTQTFRLSGPNTNASATARFEPSGRLVSLQAPNIRIGAQNDFSLNMTRGIYGLELVLRGHSLDGSRLGAESGGSDEAKFDEAFHINAKLDKVFLRDNVALSNYDFDISGVADRPATMNLSAVVGKNAPLTMTMGPSDKGRRLAFATSDMGLLLKGLFGFTSMQGGKLDVSANFNGRADQPLSSTEGAPDFQGKAVLKDFRVLNQPFLARLFSAGSLLGLANLMQGQGIAVDSLDVPFSSKNGVISVREARATGPAIGITAEGYIDRPKNAIALKGSLVPLFGLNSVLGNIPILGTVITSKEGEGIIGMTYSVSGNAGEPSISVNPLSALAPGIFRRIFEGRIPNASQAPSNTPNKAQAPTSAPAKTKSNN